VGSKEDGGCAHLALQGVREVLLSIQDIPTAPFSQAKALLLGSEGSSGSVYGFRNEP